MHFGSAGFSSAFMCCSACFAVFQTSTSETIWKPPLPLSKTDSACPVIVSFE